MAGQTHRGPFMSLERLRRGAFHTAKPLGRTQGAGVALNHPGTGRRGLHPQEGSQEGGTLGARLPSRGVCDRGGCQPAQDVGPENGTTAWVLAEAHSFFLFKREKRSRPIVV